jgi:hypothetical protein
MWKGLAISRPCRRGEYPRMAETIGVFFSMIFNKLGWQTRPSETHCTGAENSVK